MPNEESLTIDLTSRNRIIEDIQTNFFVEAGAGSGKTTMLVNRMVAMVEAGIPASKICAITFTKAAAGEFYDRFQKLLIERSNPDYVWEDKGYAGQLPIPTEETRKRCEKALEDIDLCFMGTIDSFCAMVLSEHPSEAGIPSDARIVSDAGAEAFYKQEYVKICAGDYGKDLSDLADSFRSVHRNAEEVFVEGEAVFMNNRNVRFHYDEPIAVDIDTQFAEEREKLIEVTGLLVEHPELMYDGNAASRNAWERIEEIDRNFNRRWNANLSNVLNGLKTLKNIRLLPEAMDDYGATLSGVFETGGRSGQWLEFKMEGGFYEQIMGLRYSLSMKFLLTCVPVLEASMRDKGYMTFFDYLYYLRNMLKKDAAENNGKLIQYIYDRHSYFLIDEFQDTNPMQAEVFFYLTSKHPVGKWSANKPKEGSLFIVGDPKQSIYRFRSADVASFLKVKCLFEQSGGVILSLTRNFRSTNVLCTYFNRVFSSLLPEETRNQSRFEEIPLPEKTPDEFQGIFSYQSYAGKGIDEEHPEETDPVQIGKIIERLVDNEEYIIHDGSGEDAGLRKLRYSDIMVITYGKPKLEPIRAQLDSMGIDTKVEGVVPFDSNEALIEVSKIYAAVADADNEMALVSALTGNLVKVTKEELLAFRKSGGKISLKASFDTDGCTDQKVLSVADEIKELQELLSVAKRLSPAAMFSKILEEYWVYMFVEAENLEVLYYALELMRNAEKSGRVVSLKDGSAYLQELIAGLSGEERCLNLNEKKDAVHLANLHKVKGLEAPVVILAAAPYNGGFTISKRIEHGDDGSEGYLFLLKEKDGFGSYFETDDYGEEAELEKEADEAEKDRLIYVAATRARNVLILCDNIGLSYRKETHNALWLPIIERSLPDIFHATKEKAERKVEDKVSVKAASLYKDAEKHCALNDRQMEGQTYTVMTPSGLSVASKVERADDEGFMLMEGEDAVTEVVTETEAETGVATETDGVNETEAVAGAGAGAEASAGDGAVAETLSVGVDMGIHPALLGTMTHKLMELLVSTKGQMDTESAVSEVIREYRTPLFEGFEEALTKALSDVADCMKSGGYPQTNTLPSDLLKVMLDADEVYCEVPFCYSEDTNDGKVIWNGVIDAVYRENDRWHIVDYKTNADGDDLDFRYQEQLKAYIKAFRETTGEEADAMTYHIDDPFFRPENQAYVWKSVQELRAGKGTAHELIEDTDE